MRVRGSTPFVILFTGRTGSSHLTSLLRSHPNVRAQGEGLGRLRREGADADTQLAWAREALAPRRDLLAVGFKMKLHQPLDPTGIRALLEEMAPRILRMERRNVVKHAVSEINVPRIRAAKGRANLRGKDEPLLPTVIDPAQLRRGIDKVEMAERELNEYVSSLELPVKRVAYEDLLQRQVATVLQVLDFLDVSPADLTSPVRKSTPDDLRLAITNFDELDAEFHRTRYQAMLNEDPLPRGA